MMIECRELARHVIGRVIGGRPRRSEPDVLRHRRERAEDRHRIHAGRVLITVANADLEAAAEPVGDREPVGEEQEIELALLQQLRNAHIMRERQKRGLVLGIAPDRMTVDHRARNQEPA